MNYLYNKNKITNINKCVKNNLRYVNDNTFNLY